MKLDPDIHIDMHSILLLKPSVTNNVCVGGRYPTGDRREKCHNSLGNEH